MDEYFAESNDMCVIKAMMYEDKLYRCVAEIAGVKNVLSILSESVLLRWIQNRSESRNPELKLCFDEGCYQGR